MTTSANERQWRQAALANPRNATYLDFRPGRTTHATTTARRATLSQRWVPSPAGSDWPAATASRPGGSAPAVAAGPIPAAPRLGGGLPPEAGAGAPRPAGRGRVYRSERARADVRRRYLQSALLLVVGLVLVTAAPAAAATRDSLGPLWTWLLVGLAALGIGCLLRAVSRPGGDRR